MKSEIKNIKIIYKFGAFGNPDAFGTWIYGKRPDGKTVACKNETTADGGMKVWSYWESPSCGEHEIDRCETEFSPEEWDRIKRAPEHDQPYLSNDILRDRKDRV